MEDWEEEAVQASIKKTKKRIRRLSYAFLALVLIVVVNPATISMARHQYDLYKWNLLFLGIPLPPNTTVVESHASIDADKVIDRPLVNGDHCFYYAYRQLETELSLREIEEHYAKYSLPAIHSSNGIYVEVRDYEQLPGGKKLVRVQVLDIDSFVGYDIRCS
jgi:hypothetical protein